MASINFKAPGSIPQDLLLIHDLIGDTLQLSHNREEVQEDISSSGSDSDSLASEDEIEAELMKNATEDDIKSSNVMYVLSLKTKYALFKIATVLQPHLPTREILTLKDRYRIPILDLEM